MAREESDREDLLREATALVERIELRIASRLSGAVDTSAAAERPFAQGVLAADPVVIGFRRNDAVSFFFGADPVYQFNPAGKLRRAYFQGRLIKAEAGRLVALERVRRGHEVCLIRHEMTHDEEQAFVAVLVQHLEELSAALLAGAVVVTGQVPAEGDVLGRVQRWLAHAQEGLIAIAATPRAAGP